MRRVLVVGVGGLGCPAALALAAAGVEELTLADPDVVDLTNLHRQPLHRTFDVGRDKVDSAQERLAAAFPRLGVRALPRAVDEGNVDALFEDHDGVIDATDGDAVKFLLSDAAVRARKPLVHGGVLRLGGQAMRIAPGGPCLRCLFEGPPEGALTCAVAGVLGSVAGVVGALQARLLLAPPEPPGTATLFQVDAATLAVRRVTVRRAADCPACGQPQA